jgi:hypothetical protein
MMITTLLSYSIKLSLLPPYKLFCPVSKFADMVMYYETFIKIGVIRGE